MSNPERDRGLHPTARSVLYDRHMVDIELLTQALRRHGHTVVDVTPVPANAGDYELTVDGEVLNLEEARSLLETDEADEPK